MVYTRESCLRAVFWRNGGSLRLQTFFLNGWGKCIGITSEDESLYRRTLQRCRFRL